MCTTASPVEPAGPLCEAVTVSGTHRLTVYLRGELDFASRPMLRRVILRPSKQHVPVFVDLAQLGFIDAAAIGTLVSARDVLRAGSRDLVLLHASPLLTKILAITGLTDLLDGSQNQEEMDERPAAS